MTRRSPTKNVDARAFLEWLDSYDTIEEDLDGIVRRYINGVWVKGDSSAARELRRYASGTIRTIRPATLSRLLTLFNLEAAWQQRP